MTLFVPSLTDQIANHLARRIVRWELKPGTRLPEQELARQLDVSTNSLREAFRILERQHLLRLQPRKGAVVSEVSERTAAELYEFLFILLSELAGRAAASWQPGELDDLVTVLPALEAFRQQDDMASAHQMAFEFIELAVRRFANNAYLARDILDLIPLLKRFSYLALMTEQSEFAATISHFTDLLNHVLAHDAAGAAAVIRRYGASQQQIVQRAIREWQQQAS